MHSHDGASNVAIQRRVTMQWPGVTVVYAWEPPHLAVGVARPNQVEISFTAHARAAFALRRGAGQLDIAPGAAFIVGSDPIIWSQLHEWNESLGMYPDLDLLHRLAQPTNARCIELETLVHRHDPILFSIAYAFKRALVAGQTLSDIEASSLAQLLAWRLLSTYCGIALPDSTLNGSKLGESAIRTVCEYIEAHLCTQVSLDGLAALVHLSPFHFARCFKATMGLAPHQYVIARRLELAKRLMLSTTLTVAEIAWAIGYENISHFRRVFALHTGVTPGVIRQAAGIPHRA